MSEFIKCPKCGSRRIESSAADVQKLACPNCAAEIGHAGKRQTGIASGPTAKNTKVAIGAPDAEPQASDDKKPNRLGLWVLLGLGGVTLAACGVGGLVVLLFGFGAFMLHRESPEEKRAANEPLAQVQPAEQKTKKEGKPPPSNKKLVGGGKSAEMEFPKVFKPNLGKDKKEAPKNAELPPDKDKEAPKNAGPPPDKDLVVFDFLKDGAHSTRLTGEEIYSQMLKSTVIITTDSGWGSGVLVDEMNRIVVTNHHVLDATGGRERPLTGPVVVKGILDNLSPFDKTRSGRCEIYPVKMYTGEQFTIEMMSSEVDPYLRLEDSNGNQLAEDDDSGGGLNAKIVFNVPRTDVYRIVATTFNQGLGRFTLRVTVQGSNKSAKSDKSQDTVSVQFPRFLAEKLLTDKKGYDSEALANASKYRAKVILSDESKDLALIQLPELPDGVKAVALAKTSAQPGQTVHSVGNPGASGSLWVYTSGTVRANPYFKEWLSGGSGGVHKHSAVVLETQSPTNAGDSGGPLVNETGELVAITHGRDAKANAVNLFIDITEVKDVLRKSGFKWTEGNVTPGAASRQVANADVLKVAGLLDHANPKIRTQAAVILGETGLNARPAVDALANALKDESPDVRRAAAVALGYIGPPAGRVLSNLAAALKSDDTEFRRRVLQAIAAIGPKGADLSVAVGAFVLDTDRDTSFSALAILAKVGSDAQYAFLPIGRVLEGKDRKLRLLAIDVLDQAGPAAVKLMPQLKQCVLDGDAEIRQRVLTLAESLKKTDEVLAVLLPEIIDGLKSDDTGMCLNSLGRIQSLGKNGRAAAGPVAQLYQDSKDRKVRFQALNTLTTMREGAEEAVPTLLRDLKDLGLAKQDKALHDRVKRTLTKIGRPAVNSLLRVASEDTVALNRMRAVEVIGAMGSGVKDLARERLRKIFQRDRSVSVRDAVEAVLKTYSD